MLQTAALRTAALLLLVAGLTVAAPAAEPAAPQAAAVPQDHAARMTQGLALFKQHVRPLLEAKCLKCHGGESVKADFDLATRKALIESGMIDKQAASSYLYSLITHAEEPHMPFKQEKLPPEAIANIGRWIDLGAPYDKPLVEKSSSSEKTNQVTQAERQFWSFQPLSSVEPPNVDQSDWVRTPIDRFVLAAQEDRGLTPNKEADRRTLIRRAYLVLLGLPPEPEQVDRFVADPDPDAYAKLIDRLLESPHYGERWARHWMDVARFAESHGYEQDYDRPHAYHYRDFLIRAFNDDMPYDQFVAWQIGGDELAPENPEAMMATGFLGAGAFPTQLTEAEFESARYDELDDMVSTLGTAFLGLTIGCARCHDHKFDPIPSHDYYRLAATFTTTIRSEIELRLDAAGYREALAQFEKQHAPLVAAREKYEQSELADKFAKWLDSGAQTLPAADWHVLDGEFQSRGGAKSETLDDGSLLVSGPNSQFDEYTITCQTRATDIRRMRLEALRHPSLPKQGPGRAGNGNFALSDFRLEVRPLGDKKARLMAVKFVAAEATHQQNKGGLSVAASIDDDPRSGWAVDAGGIGKDQAAVFVPEKPFGFEAGTELIFTLKFNNNGQHNLGRLRLSVTALPDAKPAVGSGLVGDVADAVSVLKAGGPNDLSEQQRRALLRRFARGDAQWQELHAAVTGHLAQTPQPQTAKVQVTSEGYPHMKHHADGRGYPHFYKQTFHLERGDVDQKKKVAEPGFLQVLMRNDRDADHWQTAPPEDARASFRRAALADWITDAENGAGHLAARVIVNRLWHYHFGRGLVATPSDFGFQGARPSHPELLDWLAADLIRHRWRLKRLHKMILASSVFRQDAEVDRQRAAIDPENVYLWRWQPRRLEAEAIRDSLLRISGQLDPRMFGPGTLDENMKRRSIYFFIKRSKLIPTMMLFDWPEHLVGIGRRSTTTTAPQALMFMNSPQCRGYAEGLAGQLSGLSNADAVTRAYREAVGRRPDEKEMQEGLAFIRQQAETHRNQGHGNAEHLARIDFCQTLLCTNEVIYVE